MKKILIAIDNDFIREAYIEVFKSEGLDAIEKRDGEGIINLIKEEKPDVVIVDILLSGVGGFKILETIKKTPLIKKIPVVIFAQLEKREDRVKAMNLEAKDFITAAGSSPYEVIRRIKIVLGEQKSYRVKQKGGDDTLELIKDLKEGSNGKCPECDTSIELEMIRDLSEGKSHFIVSLVCPNCKK